MTDPVTKMAEMVLRFNRDLIGIQVPDKPTILNFQRGEFRLSHLQEELDEIVDGVMHEDLERTADGLVDLIYVALGTLVEMGIPPGAAFEEVHEANMAKERGELSKRPGSAGYDAVKPEGWQPPDLIPYLTITREEVRLLADSRGTLDIPALASCVAFMNEPVGDPATLTFTAGGIEYSGFHRPTEINICTLAPPPKPKVLVLGHGRHGKDTVCEMLEGYGFKFTSSSMFCAEHVMLPHFNASSFLPSYSSVEECFDDRHGTTGALEHRTVWYEVIRDFNRPDATALGRAIWDENDIYCGLRSSAELHALKNAGIPDLIIWVDASERVQPESNTSCTVEPWMADFVIDNNGTLEELKLNVDTLVQHVLAGAINED